MASNSTSTVGILFKTSRLSPLIDVILFAHMCTIVLQYNTNFFGEVGRVRALFWSRDENSDNKIKHERSN